MPSRRCDPVPHRTSLPPRRCAGAARPGEMFEQSRIIPGQRRDLLPRDRQRLLVVLRPPRLRTQLAPADPLRLPLADLRGLSVLGEQLAAVGVLGELYWWAIVGHGGCSVALRAGSGTGWQFQRRSLIWCSGTTVRREARGDAAGPAVAMARRPAAAASPRAAPAAARSGSILAPRAGCAVRSPTSWTPRPGAAVGRPRRRTTARLCSRHCSRSATRLLPLSAVRCAAVRRRTSWSAPSIASTATMASRGSAEIVNLESPAARWRPGSSIPTPELLRSAAVSAGAQAPERQRLCPALLSSGASGV